MARLQSNQRRARLLLLGAIIAGLLLVGVFGVALMFRTNRSGLATLTAEVTDVIYRKQQQAELRVPTGEQRSVQEGDAVNVDPNGRAVLTFPNALVVSIYRDSRLRLEGSRDPSKAPVKTYWLDIGTTYNRADSAAQERVEINTKWATIRHIGTEFLVYFSQDEVTWVVVKNGVVEVEAAGKTVQVRAGQQVWVEPGQPPVDPLAAVRPLVGNRFPLIDDLTNRHLADNALLAPVVANAAPTATPTLLPSPTLVTTPTLSPTPRRVASATARPVPVTAMPPTTTIAPRPTTATPTAPPAIVRAVAQPDVVHFGPHCRNGGRGERVQVTAVINDQSKTITRVELRYSFRGIINTGSAPATLVMQAQSADTYAVEIPYGQIGGRSLRRQAPQTIVINSTVYLIDQSGAEVAALAVNDVRITDCDPPEQAVFTDVSVVPGQVYYGACSDEPTSLTVRVLPDDPSLQVIDQVELRYIYTDLNGGPLSPALTQPLALASDGSYAATLRIADEAAQYLGAGKGWLVGSFAAIDRSGKEMDAPGSTYVQVERC